MGEFERIARLAARFGPAQSPARGIGDDCAWVPGEPSGGLAVSVDASVEGVHFRREWLAPEELAARALHAALSDLAAAGARVDAPGAGVLCAWTVPAGTEENYFDALVEGTARAAESVGARVLGGNLSGGPALTLTSTVLGVTRGAPPGRAGARPGDVLWLAGTPGAASLGLRALFAGREGEAALAGVVRAWREPRALLREGQGAVPRARAAIDLSDGLAQDAGHLARASGVALRFEEGALPGEAPLRESARLLGVELREAQWHGGEDYALLVALPAGEHPGEGAWARVGVCEAGEGLWRGAERVPERGWTHG